MQVRKHVLGALITFTALCAPLTVEASLIAAGSVDGGGRFFAVDQQAVNTCGAVVVGPCQLPDLDPAVGSLVTGAFATGGGDLTVGFAVQTSDKGTVNRLDSTGTQFSNIGDAAHTFIGVISDTDFLGPSTEATTTGAGQWSHLGLGYGNSSIAMQWFNDPANQQGALTTSILQPGVQIDAFADAAGPANPDSFSHVGGPFAVNDPGLFSMTLRFEGLIEPGVRLTGREMTELKELAAVPQVGAGWLMGLGGLGLLASFWGRRR